MKYAPSTLWQLQVLSLCVYGILSSSANAQVNSGSDGSDGAFNPTQSVNIDMTDHPTGIYQYTSVNIPSGVTVTFTPNANNTPVVWLVQGVCVIGGTVDVAGKNGDYNVNIGLMGGPGGYAGGNGGSVGSAGLGPGGGPIGGSNASYASLGQGDPTYLPPGVIYGNAFILPLIGGSGGGGGAFSTGYGGFYSGAAGGGGGGAMLIAASGTVQINGNIKCTGGAASYGSVGYSVDYLGGGGSGGAVRLVAPTVVGAGTINAAGGYKNSSVAGNGRVRFDTLDNAFGGIIYGSFTQGFQPIIIPASGQGVQLAIQSIGGVAVATTPNGVLANPDVILPAQQTNPMNVVVNCANLPMNTTITLTVHPANGADIVATATNSAGTQANSTATIPVTMPRGGGIIYAKCVSGVIGSASVQGDNYAKNIAETGWTAYGERFAQMEITAGIGRSQQVAYITESGKRYVLPVR